MNSRQLLRFVLSPEMSMIGAVPTPVVVELQELCSRGFPSLDGMPTTNETRAFSSECFVPFRGLAAQFAP
ncbi:MAG TPA: hypothetical protein DCY13_21625 [Verrucomicrobiales bacterium]|nr:hypothetical protein [Verrucomicrobiales bacterium]